MESLRSNALTHLLTTTTSPSALQMEPIDSTKVQALVESFKNLNKSEMVLFLTRIGGG